MQTRSRPTITMSVCRHYITKRCCSCLEAASATLDAGRAALYVDLVLISITEAARRALQAMKPANYEFQSDFARHYFSQGKAEGKTEGKAELLIKLATLKFGPLPAGTQDRIRAAASAELDTMAERLLDAAALDVVLV